MITAFVLISILLMVVLFVGGTIIIIKLVNKVLGRVFMQHEVQKLTSEVAKETLKDTVETIEKITKK